MKTRKPGRKSADSLATPTPVVQTAKRLSPPTSLSRPARSVWRETVDAMPPEFFQAEHGPMLEDYCGSVAQGRALTHYLEQITPSATDYHNVSRTLASVRGMTARLATRLRLTPQARWQPAQAAAMAAKGPAEPKPWEFTGDEHPDV